MNYQVVPFTASIVRGQAVPDRASLPAAGPRYPLRCHELFHGDTNIVGARLRVSPIDRYAGCLLGSEDARRRTQDISKEGGCVE